MCRVVLLLLHSISRRGPDSFFFLDASSEDILEVEESNKTRPWLFTFSFGAKLCHTPEGSQKYLQEEEHTDTFQMFTCIVWLFLLSTFGR